MKPEPMKASQMRKQFDQLFQNYNSQITSIHADKRKTLEQLKLIQQELEQEEELFIGLQKKQGETENEIYTLKELSQNDFELHKSLKNQNSTYRNQFLTSNDELHQETQNTKEKLRILKQEIDDMKSEHS